MQHSDRDILARDGAGFPPDRSTDLSPSRVHLAHVAGLRLPRPLTLKEEVMRGSQSQILYIIKARIHGRLTGIRGVSRGKAKHHKAGAKNSFGFSELVDCRTALVLPMGNT